MRVLFLFLCNKLMLLYHWHSVKYIIGVDKREQESRRTAFLEASGGHEEIIHETERERIQNTEEDP